MSSTDLLFDLPSELACVLVGKWLFLKDVARLDSACCQTHKRQILHTSVFQSPLCIVSEIHRSYDSQIRFDDFFEWIDQKDVRLATLVFTGRGDHAICEEYLQKHGQTVLCVRIGNFSKSSPDIMSLIAYTCPHLQRFYLLDAHLTFSFVALLMTCRELKEVHTERLWPVATWFYAPATHHLQLTTIDIDQHCEFDIADVCIFRMCHPDSVKRLRFPTVTHLPSDLRGLLSLDIHHSTCRLEEELLQEVVQYSQLVNLNIGRIHLSDDDVVAVVQRLSSLRTLNLEGSYNLTDRAMTDIVAFLSGSLQALYLLGCSNVSAAGINHVLSRCRKLHTISYSSPPGIDYALAVNLTTLVMTIPEEESVWAELPLHCQELRHLYIANRYFFTMDGRTGLENDVVATVRSLPQLRTLTLSTSLANAIRDELNVCRPNLLVENLGKMGSWYNLFELPI